MEKTRDYSQGICLLRTFFYSLFLIRFNLIMLIVGWVLLLIPQGQDAIIAYASGDAAVKSTLLFFFWASYWAFSIWFFARTMYRFEFSLGGLNLDRRFFDWLRIMLPRYLGPVAFIAIAHALWQIPEEDAAGSRIGLWRFVALGMVPASYLFFRYRRLISNKLAGLITAGKLASVKHGLETSEVQEEWGLTSLRDLFNGAWGKTVIIISLVGIVATVAGFTAPVSMGFFFGAILVFFIWAGSWLPLGSLITYIGNKRGYPMVLLLLLLAVIFSAGNDNHAIRLADPAPQRMKLDSAVLDWLDQPQASEGRRDLLLVSTAGGGIRAAYWTATVLGELHKIDNFEHMLFAISGVSGGSVGASVYRALLSDGAPRETLQQRAQAVLSRDFLGPVTTALLYPDLAQRFLPNMDLMDRGRALEMAWEEAYRDETGAASFGNSMEQLYSGKSPWPALFLNATRVETGRRSVASNLRFDHLHRNGSGLFAVVDDQLADIGHDLPLSAAAHNSARFPGVSPAGHWRDEEGRIAGRIVDGGYFENYGAETILDLLQVIRENRGVEEGGSLRGVNLHIVAISSDPALPIPYTREPLSRTSSVAHELLSPLDTLLNTRSARGIEALNRLETATRELNGTFYHFRMLPSEGSAPGSRPPLGRTLPGNAM